MNHKILTEHILFYYDEPLSVLFTTKDFCILTVAIPEECVLPIEQKLTIPFFASKITHQQWVDCKNQKIDFREPFENPDLNQWYLFDYYNREKIILHEIESSQIQEDFLPEKGELF